VALSTAIKNKMLAVRDLSYYTTIEIKNDSGSWVDFTDRDPIIGKIRLSTERIPNKIVSSVSAVVLDNADRYFDYMDKPSDSTTASLFGTKASGFSTGFPGREVRLGLKMTLDDGTYENAYLGIYQIGENIETDHASGKAKLPLRPDIWKLKESRQRTENRRSLITASHPSAMIRGAGEQISTRSQARCITTRTTASFISASAIMSGNGTQRRKSGTSQARLTDWS
jgi:hypothetical protein